MARPQVLDAVRVMVSRELLTIELKQEITELCRQAGHPPRYSIVSVEQPSAPE